MIKDIIVKIRKSETLADHEREFLEYVISRPKHNEWAELYLAGLV